MTAPQLCEWCRNMTTTPMRDVQVAPDKRVRDARVDLCTVPGARIRVGGCCASIVARQLVASAGVER